jgi:signal transduction histidine kinase
MNFAAAIAIAAAALSAGVGLVSLRISRAPGSGDQRWFYAVAFASSVYSLGGAATTLGLPPEVVVPLIRLQVAALMVNVWGWIQYSNAFLGRGVRRWERVASVVLLAGTGIALVPRVIFLDATVDRPYAPFGIVYRQAIATPLGNAVITALIAAALLILVRFVRASRAGVPHARLMAAAFVLFVGFGVVDELGTAGLAHLPFLEDAGIAVPVLAMGWVITARFVASANELDGLRRALLVEVEARTKDLATALEALHQSEKLAALGQFASGVAHEVNSPAAVVATNLRYLADSSSAGRFPPDGPEVIDDALAAMKRINDLVRKLVDAGRVAAVPGGVSTVPVEDLVRKAAAEARARGGGRIAVSEEAPPGVAVRARRESLEQVLSILVANAAEAIPRGRDGRVEIRAERADATVRISVRDDGTGMSAEVLRRAFDPFFTTKPAGTGSGLGLPVARGLVEANGGSLRLESVPGAGTTAHLELPDVVEIVPPRA